MKKFRFLLVVLFSVCTLLISQGFAQNDKFRRSRNPTPNRYIVVLQDEAVKPDFVFSPLSQKMQIGMLSRDLAHAHNGSLDHVYTSALKGFSVEMPAHNAAALSRDPRVKYVEEDFTVWAEESQTNAPFPLDRIDQRYLDLDMFYNYDTSGSGVHAYVIDTGIRSTHAEFSGRVVFGADFVGDGKNGNDCHGHGTHVAGILGGETYGVAKDVIIHNVRVIGCDGRGTGSAILGAIDWVTNNNISPAVVNFSIGMDGVSVSLENAIANSVAQGVNYSLSAGNANIDACNHSPGGRVPTAVTVAATDRWDDKPSFSNYGSCVDIFAPGVTIYSAWYTSDTAVTILSGTSMSSPHVAGVIARLLQTDPTASPAEIKSALLAWASQVVIDGGPGSPRGLLYSNTSLVSVPPTPVLRIPNGGIAAPYPAEYIVSGAPTTLSSVPGSIKVNINGFNAADAHQIVLVLVGPDGTAMGLQEVREGFFSAFDVSYTITDTAEQFLGFSGISDGWSYRPAVRSGTVVDFPAPGPGTNYVLPYPVQDPVKTLSGTFGGKNPNGTWKLFVLAAQASTEPSFEKFMDSWSITIPNPRINRRRRR